MSRRGKLQAAADNRAVHDSDDRHAAEFDLLECLMPGAGVEHALGHAVQFEFGKVETGGEVIARTMQHDGLDLFRQAGKERFQPGYDFVVERIALLRTVEPQNGNIALLFGMQGGRKFGQRL